jgi:hypothetical protein
MNIGKPTTKLPQGRTRRDNGGRNQDLIERALTLKPGQGLPIHCEDVKERNSVAGGLRMKLKKEKELNPKVQELQSLHVMGNELTVWIVREEEK